MPTASYAGQTVSVSDEGFFNDPGQWTEDMAPQIAKAEGILTNRGTGKSSGFETGQRCGQRARVRILARPRGSASGALPAVPQGPSQDRGQGGRHPQAQGLHLNHRVTRHRTRPRGLTGRHAKGVSAMDGSIEKVSIIVSKGSLEGIYPALIMANGARAEGIEVNLFFTFFGIDAVSKKRHEHIKVASVGNPGLHLATLIGALPGVPGLMTQLPGTQDGQARHPAHPRVH
jgi:hypothetical protein